MCLLLALPLPSVYLWQPLTALTRQTSWQNVPLISPSFLYLYGLTSFHIGLHCLSRLQEIVVSVATAKIVVLHIEIWTKTIYVITNLDLVMEKYFYATLSTFSLLIKALALPFNRLYLSKASQASLLGLNDFCIYFPVLINL